MQEFKEVIDVIRPERQVIIKLMHTHHSLFLKQSYLQS